MSAEATCRFEELENSILAVTLRPELNEIPWTDIERIGSGIVGRVDREDRPRILVDLTELSHMGSAMVALVVRIWKAVTEKSGRMVVVNRSEVVGEVLEISGLAGKWTIVPSREQALTLFGGTGMVAAGFGAGNPVAGVVLAVGAAVLFLVSVLALADAASQGFAAAAIGRQTVLAAGVVCALVAFALGLIAAFRTVGSLRLGSAVVAALSFASAVVGGAMLLTDSRPAVLPAIGLDDAPVRQAEIRGQLPFHRG